MGRVTGGAGGDRSMHGDQERLPVECQCTLKYRELCAGTVKIQSNQGLVAGLERT